MNQQTYVDKPAGYFDHVRRELINEVPLGPHAVLEIGCGEGGAGAVLKSEGRARFVAGVELFKDAARKASLVLDQVIVGNIEQIDLPFNDGQFDVIILGDVLEHLVDPWEQVRRLSIYLADGGSFVASLPNVRNWRVVFPLLISGKWEYQHIGIMDRTHLRFFTRQGMIDLFEKNGFTVTKIEPLGRKSRFISRFLCGFLRELAVPQYLVVSTRKKEMRHAG